MASTKEECLAKLMKYDFSPEGLPVSLGGTWTGGCEPWRKGCHGDDELSLEIETDLRCLFRNALWLHRQAVAARSQQSSSYECDHIPPLEDESNKSNESMNELHYCEGRTM
jgi:hypothetical protein